MRMTIGCLLLLHSVIAIQQNTLLESEYQKQSAVKSIHGAVKNPSSELHHLAYERLAYIVDTYGPRLWGSDSQALAVGSLFEQMKSLGFNRVELESLGTIKTWRRGAESLTLFEPRPFPQRLNLIGLGLSVPGNVTGNVVVVKDFAQLDAFRHLVKGKIVCFNHEWTDYDDGYDYRNDGASQAAKYGAIGALVRSITPNSIDSPHTGALEYDPRYPQIPAAAISIEDADMLQRMQNRGQEIRVNLYLESEWYESTSHNLIAEITGSESPNEILLLGGHFDSWDTGSQAGANDDGGGVMVCLEALHVLASLGLRPKRTIRFIAWSGEEMGLPGNGADQYMVKHASEIEHHVLAFESDEGTTKPYGFGFSGGPNGLRVINDIAKRYLGQIDANKIVPDDGVMVDTTPLFDAGVPVIRNEIEDTPTNDFYFTYHHSAGDTMTIMNADDMDDNVVAIASLFYLVANLDDTFPRN